MSFKKNSLDNASGAEYGSNFSQVQIPAVQPGCILHQGEALGICDDFSGIQGFADHGCKRLFIRREADSR